jgi:hypothetical protein
MLKLRIPPVLKSCTSSVELYMRIELTCSGYAVLHIASANHVSSTVLVTLIPVRQALWLSLPPCRFWTLVLVRILRDSCGPQLVYPGLQSCISLSRDKILCSVCGYPLCPRTIDSASLSASQKHSFSSVFFIVQGSWYHLLSFRRADCGQFLSSGFSSIGIRLVRVGRDTSDLECGLLDHVAFTSVVASRAYIESGI